MGVSYAGTDCRCVAHRHSRLFRSSSTIADAMQYPKRLAARTSPSAMADAARSIASRSSASRTTAAATACERTNVGSGALGEHDAF